MSTLRDQPLMRNYIRWEEIEYFNKIWPYFKIVQNESKLCQIGSRNLNKIALKL